MQTQAKSWRTNRELRATSCHRLLPSHHAMASAASTCARKHMCPQARVPASTCAQAVRQCAADTRLIHFLSKRGNWLRTLTIRCTHAVSQLNARLPYAHGLRPEALRTCCVGYVGIALFHVHAPLFPFFTSGSLSLFPPPPLPPLMDATTWFSNH